MPAPPNVILVIYDTMRRDSLSLYGGPVSTPNIDSFAREATVYPNGIAASPWTAPSHASFFLGKYPSEHGVHESYTSKVRDIVGMMSRSKGETIAQWLKTRGYLTAGVSANPMLSVHNGFDRGFDSFGLVDGSTFTLKDISLLREASMGKRTKKGTIWHFASHGRFRDLIALYLFYRRRGKIRQKFTFPNSPGGEEVVRIVERKGLEDPFFLFLNFMEMHEPYTHYEKRRSNWAGACNAQVADLFGLARIPDETMAEIKRRYYLRAADADRYFGQLVAFLKRTGQYENSLVIVSSDHGQALKEHGFYGHGTYLHDELVRVPLIVKYPGRGVRAVGMGYQSLTRIPHLIKATVGGAGLDDPITTEAAFAESFGNSTEPPLSSVAMPNEKLQEARRRLDRPRKAVFKAGYKMVLDWSNKEVEEFTFQGRPADPNENRGTITDMLDSLIEFETRSVPDEIGAASLTTDEEAVLSERLRALGYL